MRFRKSLFSVAAVAALAVGLLSACDTPSQLTDAADPDVVWTGSSYLLHTTNTQYGNVPTWTSTDLQTWTWAGDALPTLPAWAASGYTWAPSALRTSKGWVLYFSAAVNGKTTRNGQPLKCVGVATSTSPTGPFTAASSPLLCDESAGGDIDPSPIQTARGMALVYKIDGNANYQPTKLLARPLTSDGVRFSAGPSTLLSSSSTTWERGIVEGPDAATIAGRRHLVYSGGDYSASTYGEGQGLCPSYKGACNRNGRLLTDPTADGYGAGGASLFTDARGAAVLAWHAYSSANPPAGSPRYLYVGSVSVQSNNTLKVTPIASPSVQSTGGPAAVQGVALQVPPGTAVVVPHVVSRY